MTKFLPFLLIWRICLPEVYTKTGWSRRIFLNGVLSMQCYHHKHFQSETNGGTRHYLMIAGMNRIFHYIYIHFLIWGINATCNRIITRKVQFKVSSGNSQSKVRCKNCQLLGDNHIGCQSIRINVKALTGIICIGWFIILYTTWE